MKLSVNNKYKILHGLYWMMFCVGTGFISMYLQGREVETAGIGVATAIFGVLASFLQPALGRICDRSSQITWRHMTLILSTIFMALCIIMPLVPGKLAGAIFMGSLMLLASITTPFINTAHFYYSRRGKYINFGIARGIGSGMYALLALLIGALAEKFGAEVLPVCGAVIAFFFIIITLRMPIIHDDIKDTAKAEPQESGKVIKQQKGFLRKYPVFAIMLLASLMMLTSHNIATTYLLQIIQSLGGDSRQLGIAMAIQAIVEVPVLFSFSKLVKRVRPGILMLTASVGYAVKALLYAVSGSMLMLYLTQTTQMFSFAIFASASVYYTSQSISEEDQTTGQAYMGSMMSAGMVVGSLLGGWLLQLAGIATMLIANLIVSLLGVIFAVISVTRKGLSDKQ